MEGQGGASFSPSPLGASALSHFLLPSGSSVSVLEHGEKAKERGQGDVLADRLTAVGVSALSGAGQWETQALSHRLSHRGSEPTTGQVTVMVTSSEAFSPSC